MHSDYSMIDGLATTAPLVKKAAALGMPALAITDFTNLCGLVKFYGAGHGAGIKPIVGADFNVQCDLLGDELTHLTVLAANNTGDQNLRCRSQKRISAVWCRLVDHRLRLAYRIKRRVDLLPADAWATSGGVFGVVTARW
ncbi:PHP domain-containing protein [Shigella flexneri]